MARPSSELMIVRLYLQVWKHPTLRLKPRHLAEPCSGLRLHQRELDQQQRLPPDSPHLHRRPRSPPPVGSALPPDDHREQSLHCGHAHRGHGER